MSKDSPFHVVVLRPRLILGKGRVGTIEKLSKLIASPFPLFLIGNGKNRYQFIAANDVCSAIILSIEKDVRGIFNIGSDNPPTLDDLFENTLRNLHRRKIVLKIPARIANTLFGFLDFFQVSPLTPEQYRIASLDYTLDTNKIKGALGWKPVFSDEMMLTESLRDLLG
jgi:dTDP-glucose 4,6-dehydratase